jgi:hypothetical protein
MEGKAMTVPPNPPPSPSGPHVVGLASDSDKRSLEMSRYFWMDRSLGRAEGKAAFLFTGYGVVAASLSAASYFVPNTLHRELARVTLRDAVIFIFLAMLATLLAAMPNPRTSLNLSSPTEINKAFEDSLRFKRVTLIASFVCFAIAVVLVTIALVDSGRVI